MEKCLKNQWIVHYTHHVEELFYLCNKMHFKITKPITILFNNCLLTLKPSSFPRLWHELIIYEPHSSSKMDSGWMVL
jgi:hypothetical protein